MSASVLLERHEESLGPEALNDKTPFQQLTLLPLGLWQHYCNGFI